MVTFYQFVQPALHYLSSGAIKLPLTLKATCTGKLHNRPGRFEYQRGILQQTHEGQFEVSKTGKQGSGILTSMSEANCFILLAEDCATIEAGDSVLVQPFDTFI
jgi:molybdopterin molybdotransferase